MSVPGGWVGKILQVDLTQGRVSCSQTQPYVDDYLGGRALAGRLAWDEIPAGIDAFDPQNRIIITTGPLTGTLAPTSGRTVMASISPRTYPTPWYTHSTIGGWFGPELKYAGYDALVVSGRASGPMMIEIQDDRVRLVDATNWWGEGAREVQLGLKASYGSRAQVLTIGPAGENLVRFATVQHSEDNAAGHSGFGAVWGSKRLKAIVVRGTGSVPVARPEMLLGEVLAAGKFQIAPYTGVLGGEARRQQRPICTQACTFNCMNSAYTLTEDGRRIPAQCVGSYAWAGGDGMADTHYEGGGLRVPAGRNFGLGREAELHERCNSLGLDVWFRLVMQPWFVRARELGVTEIGGFAIDPQDGDWFERFMHQLAHREGLGALFAEDLRRAVDTLADELPDELITLACELEFNFGFPAHREGRFWDEEPLPFWAISAMMHAGASRDPTIGAHQSVLILAGFMLADREAALRQFRRIAKEVWGDPDALEPNFERKAPVAIWSERQHILIDSLPLCDFGFPQLVRPLAESEDWQTTLYLVGDLELDRRLLQAVTGREWTRQQLEMIADRAFTLERALLARAGRGRTLEEAMASHFELPCRADGTRLASIDFPALLDAYYSERGWDLEFGWPQAPLLQRLGLEALVQELEMYRQQAAGCNSGKECG